MIFIPRTPPKRQGRTYAQLVARVRVRRSLPFEGRFFRTGSKIDEAELHPSPDSPATPLLIEFAGSDGSGRGAGRSKDIHVLWRYVDGAWDELARVRSEGPEWMLHLMPIIQLQIVRPPVNHVEAAGKMSERVLRFLDQELDALEDEGRERAMSFLYDQFSARLVA